MWILSLLLRVFHTSPFISWVWASSELLEFYARVTPFCYFLMECPGFTKVCSKISWLPGEFCWKCILVKMVKSAGCLTLWQFGGFVAAEFQNKFQHLLFLNCRKKSLIKALIIKFINLLFAVRFFFYPAPLLSCLIAVMEWIQAGFYFLSPWYLQLYEHVCICESVGIQGIKNEFVYQAREERLCSLPATDKITISIPIAKYSWCIQNKDTMAFLVFFFLEDSLDFSLSGEHSSAIFFFFFFF